MLLLPVVTLPTSEQHAGTTLNLGAMRGVKKNDNKKKTKHQQAVRDIEDKLQELVSTKTKTAKGRPNPHHYLLKVHARFECVWHSHKTVVQGAGWAAASSYVCVVYVCALRR